jgi:hypothetical protein
VVVIWDLNEEKGNETVKLIKDAGGNAALKSISIKHKGSKMEN